MDRSFKFKLGETLKDIVTGFEGVALGRTQYFTGCNHYGLCPRQVPKDSKPDDWVWLDESRLVTVSKKKILFSVDIPTSGPHPNPPKM